MGNAASKNSRKFVQNKPNISLKKNEKIYTTKPPFELDGEENSNSNNLFNKVVNKGIVNITDKKAEMKFNENHESIQVLKNRVNIEKQYEGLFIPKNADLPDTPERFLKKEDIDKINKIKKINVNATNTYGLIDSSKLSEIITNYKVKDKKDFIGFEKLQKLIDDGIIDLPKHKVTLHESIDNETKKVKQKLIVVKDNWIEEMKTNGEVKLSKDKEILEQFKMLEDLVSKSQIGKKENEENGEEEVVLNRKPKRVSNDVKKMV